ncbi:PAS domain S-box protein [Xylophilus rhododendri]|uniref:Sensory/regulatory protein RpfC n=1 Tax=Xylophilus rhododendri TaxID=2697032 RepID=A0A857J4T0_9BURK|nr:PAS domain S-box protein [Xylophilus rhododendri]QHI97855.1 PAS domain S-box protein [Xylophilus rhododendri]
MFSPLEFLPASQIAPSALLMGNYDGSIVALSLVMAVLASIAALQIAGVTSHNAGRPARALAIVSASFILGAGIWSMHFIGMLAFRLCTAVSYHALPTLLTMLPGLAAAFVAVLLMTRAAPTQRQRVASGVLIGAGIGAMHYSGMAAMSLAPQLRYDPLWFALSLAVGVGLSVLALQVHGALARVRGLSVGIASVAGGTVLGLGIACTHYVGMHAAIFVGAADPAFADAGPPMTLALGVALVSLLLIAVFGSIWGLLHYRAMVALLRSNEQRLQSVVDGTAEGIVVLDARGRIYRFNRSAERVSGHSAVSMMGRRLDALLVTADEMLQAYMGGRPLPDGSTPAGGLVREVEIRRPDGRVVEARLSIGRVVMPNEQIFVAFISDIGEQKRTERALREREAQHGALIRNVPGAFFRIRLDERLSTPFMSEQIRSIVGWSATEFMSGRLNMRDVVHPDDAAKVEAAVAAVSASPGMHDFRIEHRVIHADGSHRWIASNCEVEVPIDGSAPHIDGVMVDVTEAKLRTAEFEGTVRAIGHALAVIEFDVAGRVLTANDNFLRLLGYTLEEIRGQRHAMFCAPDYVTSPGYTEFWNTLRRGEFHIGEYERFGKDGRPVWLHASYNPVLGADGRLLKIVKFASDVSERRAVHQALGEAKDRAEQAAAARAAFLANMSHEIRTPMNAVIGFTELLLDTQLSGMQRSHLEIVRHSAGSLLDLLNSVLDTAKLEKGAMELEQRDFSLRELTRQVTDSLRIGAMSKQVAVRLEYEDTLSEHFRGDPMRLRQVLVNLVSNAVKFTEQGSVRVVVRREDGKEAPQPGMVPLHIAVHDTGIGIAPDRIDAIFQPFSQADASMSRRFGGTGLGITIAQQLVGLMGGRIAVQSRLGEGSVFHIHVALPAAEPALPKTAEPVAPRQDTPQLSVLVVDDIAQNAELLRIVLEADGHQVEVATDGAAAVSAWSAGRFDLVLMDVHMPGTDGCGATRRIRALESSQTRPRTAIVALTASVLEEDRRAASEAGMDGFVAKPIELARLQCEITRALEAVRALQAGPRPGEAAVGDGTPQLSAALPALPALAALTRGEIDSAALQAIDQALRQRGDFALADLLADAIGQFDFERAANLLRPLAPVAERMAA